MPADRRDRVFLVTGGSSGIGAATARAAYGAGWRVVLAARSEDRLREVAEGMDPERVLALRCDVTEWDDVRGTVAAAVERFGRIDAVFANAGFGATRGFLEETVEHWRSMVLTNVYGAALTIRATVPHIRESAGHVLLTGSVAGTKPLPGSLYSATKHAVHAMAESLRLELHGSGARVTLVAAGVVDTPFYDSPVTMEALAPEDMARTVMWVLDQPRHMDVNTVLVRPTAQDV
jgi:NADP-dependent 3-hydroxy acid dehydrogenase YdfG